MENGDTVINPILMTGEAEDMKSVTLVDYGPLGNLLISRGYGWLLETDNEHLNMFEHSLSDELDIDLQEIWYKIRCVLLPLPQACLFNTAENNLSI